MEPGIYYGLANSDYHANAGISKTGLALFAKSPLHYWAGYLDPAKPEEAQTDAQKFGTLTHCAVLEAESLPLRYLVAPNDDGRTTLYKDAKAVAEKAGVEIIKPSLMAQAALAASAVHQHSVAGELLVDGIAEASFYWEDPGSGVLCKARPDYMTSKGVLVDLKIVADGSMAAFQKAIANYKYHWQAAMGIDAYRAQYRKHPMGYVWIVQEKERPFATYLYQPCGALIEIGRREYQELLPRFAECLEKGVWPGPPTAIQTIALPGWAMLEAVE